MKKCSYCQIEKNSKEFGSDKYTKDGLTHSCKKCISLRTTRKKIQKLSVEEKGRKFQLLYLKNTYSKNELMFLFNCSEDEYNYAIDYFKLNDSENKLLCSKCNKLKNKDEFAIDNNRKTTGRKNWCLKCCNMHKNQYDVKMRAKEKNSEYYQKNKNIINKKNSEYYYNHTSEHSARIRYYKLKRKKATPDWADYDKIMEIYRKAKEMTNKTGIIYEVDHIIPLNGKNVCGLHVENNLQILTQEKNRLKFNYYNFDS